MALTLVALILTCRSTTGAATSTTTVAPLARRAHADAHPDGSSTSATYDELYLRLWWGLTRVAGYLLPLAVWQLFFRRDRLLDFGLRADAASASTPGSTRCAWR